MRFFTLAELAAAFALLLPQPTAQKYAQRWFELFADSVDTQGYYVHEGPWDDGEANVEPPRDTRDWNAPDLVASDELLFAGFSEPKADLHLLHLGDLQLGLVALVNDDLYERMRVARGFTPRQAERNRLQLRRAIDAYQRRVKAGTGP